LVFHEVQADLEAEGYEVQPYVLPAVSVNAPHRRDRVWFVAYATRSSKRTDEFRGLRCQDGEVGGERSQTIHNAFGSDGIEGDASDSNLHGCNERNGNDEINSSEGRINAFGDINQSDGNGDAADTNLQRCQWEWEQGVIGKKRERGEERFSKLDNIKYKWQKFPTVSPICTGDDGISDRLDAITFPKWRNESIKAGGNAIVPQVVYQIFKTIEAYEKLNNVNNPVH